MTNIQLASFWSHFRYKYFETKDSQFSDSFVHPYKKVRIEKRAKRIKDFLLLEFTDFRSNEVLEIDSYDHIVEPNINVCYKLDSLIKSFENAFRLSDR